VSFRDLLTFLSGAHVLGIFTYLAVGCEPVPPCPRVRASSSAENAGDTLASRRKPGAANVVGARELDRQGVRAYADGRYSDAVVLFRESFTLGGPASELWNIARSEERQDHPESAAKAIEAYLAQTGLTPEDRAGAERELESLRARPSLVTVTSTPPGASVTVDGLTGSQAVTPVTFEVTPGAHTLALRRDSRAAQTVRIDARFGRAIVLDVTLDAPP
jgi:PEGA domain-containing protein